MTHKKSGTGHRQRIRERFLAGEAGVRTDEALLELLLAYAIPQKDVKPLAKQLLAKFGGLPGVLAADVNALCQVSGIKENTAILLKVADWIRTHRTGAEQKTEVARETSQTSLFDLAVRTDAKHSRKHEEKKPGRRIPLPRSGTGLFGEAALEEAIEWLPKLPDTDSFDEIGSFLKQNLPFSAQSMRQSFQLYCAPNVPRRSCG